MNRAEFSSSRLDVGSSARIIFGLLVMALAMAILCLSPPLRVSGNRLARLAKSKYLSRFIALFFLSSFLVPANARGSSMFSSTIRDGMRLKNWKMNPMEWSLRADFWSSFNSLTFLPKSLTFPLVGASRRPIILSKVDFPTPDFPLMEMKSFLFVTFLSFHA